MATLLRWAAALAVALACLPCAADAPSARPAAREVLVQRATDALARGDAEAALRDFEAAAAQEHAADIELGIVRSLMLAGEYRRALAFAAHTARAHPDDPEGARLYARLLDIGGQAALAARLRAPDAPLPVTTNPPLATGVVIDAGRHALLPLHSLHALHDGAIAGLHDAQGRALAAQLVQRNETLGLALLRLDVPLPTAPRLAWAAREAFAGSVAHAVAATPTPAALPPWPRLHTGFVGALDFGTDPSANAQGGVVLDRAGRAIGLALRGEAGTTRLIGAVALRAWLGDLLAEPAGDDAGAAPLPLDALYERALRATVQLMPPA